MGEAEKDLEATENTEEQAADEQQEPTEGETTGSDDSENVKDKHGQPGINKERHDKMMAAKDKEIADLKAQIAEQAETKEGREKLEQQIADMEAKHEDEKLTYQLELAKCKNPKAAKALLGDYENDISKLKAECPYLFDEEKQTGRAGGKAGGAPDGFNDKIDEAMGIKKG